MPKEHKGERDTSLFNGHRREIRFKGEMKRWEDDKGRMHARLQLKMQITSAPLLGLPDFISADFTAMEKDNSPKTYVEFQRYMLGMAVDIFPNETQESPSIRLTDCEFDKFFLEKAGGAVWLHWQLDTPNNKLLYDAMWEWYNGIGFIVCDYDANRLPMEEQQKDDPAQASLPDDPDAQTPERAEATSAAMDKEFGVPVVAQPPKKRAAAKRPEPESSTERREQDERDVRKAAENLRIM